MDAVSFATLAQAYAWLDGHADLERRLDSVSYDAVTFGLEPFRRRLGGLGDPHRGLRAIHVAGTRGKGSAALALGALLAASGLSTAVFTSPHIHEYRERIRIDGRPLAPERFRELLGRVAAVPPEGGEPPHPTGFKTVFENLTALFFLAARQAGVDWAVVETGLGGRLDATNVLDPGPVLLTRIGLEHTYLLGDTLQQIAGEKAAILKPGGWAVAGAQVPPTAEDSGAEAVFRARAAEVGAALWEAPRLCPVLETAPRPDGQHLSIEFEGGALTLELPLYGTFVAENLQNALAMLSVMRNQGLVPATPAGRLIEALGRLYLPGRLERVCRHPELFADGAHCPTGATALADSMLAHFGQEPADLVVGMMTDKDRLGFLAALARWPGWRRVICYRPAHARAADPAILAEAARRFFDDVKTCSVLDEALQFLTLGDEKNRRAVATGTLYSVAALQDWGRRRDRAHECTVQATTPSQPGTDSGDS